MKSLLKFIVVSMVFFGVSCATMTPPSPNISGTWTMDVKIDAASGSPTFVLTQEGETITGTYSGQLGEAPVTGSFKEGNVELIISASGMGQEMKMTYAGTLEEDGSLKGTVDLGELGKGTFTGKMQ